MNKLTTKMGVFMSLLLIYIPWIVKGQSLSLDSCYYLASQHLPTQKSFKLITENKELEINNLNKSLRPSILVGAQATFQSEVTRLPFNVPGTTVNPLSRDQYKVYTDISQSILPLFYKEEKENLIIAQSGVSQKKSEIEIYKLREVILQTYFGLLLLDGQMNQIKPVLNDIQTGIEKLTANQNAGTSSKTQVLILEAEKLKIEQKQGALLNQQIGLTNVLSHFINRSLVVGQTLDFPTNRSVSPDLKREEMSLFESQKQIIQQQKTTAKERLRPVVQLFAQGGYGRPGLNMLNNSFDFYYLGGLRVQLNLSNRYTYKNDIEKLNIQSQFIQIEQEQFELNINIALDKQLAEIKKYQNLMDQSTAIIKIRNEIKEMAKSQLDNGILSALDYLSFIESEDMAIQEQLLYKIQLAMAQENYRFILGN